MKAQEKGTTTESTRGNTQTNKNTTENVKCCNAPKRHMTHRKLKIKTANAITIENKHQRQMHAQ